MNCPWSFIQIFLFFAFFAQAHGESRHPLALKEAVASSSKFTREMRDDILSVLNLLSRCPSFSEGVLMMEQLSEALYFELRRGGQPVNPDSWLQRR